MRVESTAAAGLKARPELAGLTGLRGLGALWVFGYHASFNMGLPVLESGYFGVDIFFVLSGFILCYAHPRTGWTLGRYARFLQARVARIWPMHLAALLALVLLLQVYPRVTIDFGATAPERFSLGAFVASALLVQNWGITSAAVWNVPAWSLSAEWLASLLFPLVVWGAAIPRRPALALAAALASAALVWVALHLTHNPSLSVTGRAGLLRLAFEFSAGALACRAAQLGLRLGPWPTALAAAVFVAAVLNPAFLPLAVVALPPLILSAAQPGTVLARVLAVPPLRVLGEISYSLYLLHWMLLLAFNRLVADAGVAGPARLAATAGLLLLTVGVAAVTYRCIEVPCRNWLRPRRAPRPGAADGLVAGRVA